MTSVVKCKLSSFSYLLRVSLDNFVAYCGEILRLGCWDTATQIGQRSDCRPPPRQQRQIRIVLVQRRRPVIRRLMPEIRVVQFRVMPAAREQRLVAALFDDRAFFQRDDAVHGADRRKAVRDETGRALLEDQVR